MEMTTFVLVGFTCKRKSEDLQKPRCMFWGTVIPNASLKVSKLQTYFKANVACLDVKSLQAKRACFNSRVTMPNLRVLSVDKPQLMVS